MGGTHTMHGEDETSHNILVGKLEGNRPLRRWSEFEDNTRKDMK
jgi:hypothetical protein